MAEVDISSPPRLLQTSAGTTTVRTESQWVGRQHGRLRNLLSYAALILCVALIGLPVYWMIVGSFKPTTEIYRIPPTWLPEAPTVENFVRAWRAAPFGRYYLNTLITTFWGSGFEILFAVTSAYAFAFLRFPKKEWFFLLLLAALMVPGQVTILPNYLTIARLGWVNTYQGIIVPGASVAYGTFLLRQYYRTLPLDIMDAARVDGASHWRMLWTIIVPLARPAIISFGLLSVVSKWDHFLWPLIVVNTKLMRVLPIGIRGLIIEEGTIDWGVVMAGTLFVVLPVLVVLLYAATVYR